MTQIGLFCLVWLIYKHGDWDDDTVLVKKKRAKQPIISADGNDIQHTKRPENCSAQTKSLA